MKTQGAHRCVASPAPFELRQKLSVGLAKVLNDLPTKLLRSSSLLNKMFRQEMPFWLRHIYRYLRQRFRVGLSPQHHTSNLFRDKQRVSAYGSRSSSGDGGIVASVQFASPLPQDRWKESIPPFSVEHLHGAEQKIRFVHVTDFALQGHRLDDYQARPGWIYVPAIPIPDNNTGTCSGLPLRREPGRLSRDSTRG